MENEVRLALIAAGYSETEIQLETTQSGNVGGFLISDKFVGLSQVQRQEDLWTDLRRQLTSDQLQRIVSILTMTPDEIEDDVRVAHG